MSLTFERLREANEENQKFYPTQKWTVSDWGCAMVGEAGEVCDAIKKLNRGDGCKSAIAEELADVVIYADLLAQHLGISLEEAIRKKFAIVADRVESGIRL